MPAGGPSPAAEFYMLLNRRVFECAVTAIVEKRVAHCVPTVSVFQRRTLSRREMPAFDHPPARIGPHIGDIQIRLSVRVVVEPTGAHSGTNVFHARTRG